MAWGSVRSARQGAALIACGLLVACSSSTPNGASASGAGAEAGRTGAGTGGANAGSVSAGGAGARAAAGRDGAGAGGASGSAALDSGLSDAGGAGAAGTLADAGAMPDGGAQPDGASPTAGDCGDSSCGGSDVCCIRAVRDCGGATCPMPLPAATLDYECSSEAACTDGLRRRCATHADCAAGELCCASGPATRAPITEVLTSRAGDQKCQATCGRSVGEAPIGCMSAHDCPNNQQCCRTTSLDGSAEEFLVQAVCATECAVFNGEQRLCASEAECPGCRASMLVPGIFFCPLMP